jgi:hypothetical protein
VPNQFTRGQATIPDPTEDVRSLRTTALATKELVETLAGQRGSRDDQAVRWGELPQTKAPVPVADVTWNPIPYINGWADYGAPYGPAGFRKLSNGLVLMRGLCALGTVADICVLPAGYCPGMVMVFNVQTNPNIACRLDVHPGGILQHVGGSNAWISLSNICFLAEN